MSTIPTTPISQPGQAETVEERFRRLATAWQDAVWFSSSPPEKCSHPAFRAIIGMGEEVVPLMLREMEEEPQLWVWALPEITGANPVPASDAGNIAKMNEAWLRWGKEHGYR